MDTTNVASELFEGGTALAGLILVFLGSVFAAYESHDPAQRALVLSKYQRRAYLAFAGLILALAAAVLAFAGNWSTSPIWLCAATIALGASFIVLLAVAVIAIRDMS